MLHRITSALLTAALLAGCDPSRPVEGSGTDGLPDGGFLPIACPGGYQCIPDPEHGCGADYLYKGQHGLCTVSCYDPEGGDGAGAPDDEACYPGTECIPGVFACARRCESDEDCTFGEAGSPFAATCHTYPSGDSVCSSPFDPLPSGLDTGSGEDGGEGGSSTGG